MRPIIRRKQQQLWHFVRLAADGYYTVLLVKAKETEGLKTLGERVVPMTMGITSYTLPGDETQEMERPVVLGMIDRYFLQRKEIEMS